MFYILILVGIIYLGNSGDTVVLPGNGFRDFMCFQQIVKENVVNFDLWS